MKLKKKMMKLVQIVGMVVLTMFAALGTDMLLPFGFSLLRLLSEISKCCTDIR